MLKCKKPPKKVQQNAVFLIYLRYTSLEDLRADGLPQYDTYGGKRTLTVKVADDADDIEVIITSRTKEDLKENLKSNNKYHFERLYHSWNVPKQGKQIPQEDYAHERSKK